MRLRPTMFFGGAAVLLLAALLTVFALSTRGKKTISATSWEQARGAASVFGEKGDRAAINAVVRGGPGLVAVGYYKPDAAVWISSDGLSWERVRDTGSAFAGADISGMSGLVAAGPGFVAVGGSQSDGDWDAAVWVSRDARSWRRVPADETVFGGPGNQLMRAVVAAGPGLVAAGFDSGNAAVWVSSDGLVWRRIRAGESVFGGAGEQEMNAVCAGGPGLVAVGRDSGDAAVWVSANGLSWRRVDAGLPVFAGAGEQRMYGLAAAGSRLVGVGYDNGTAAAWASEDGISWTRGSVGAPTAGPAAVWSEMLAVVKDGPALVAVGVAGAGFGGSDAAVWTSTDGRSWESASGSEHAFGFEGNQAMAAVTTGGPGLVAAGEDRNAAAVWTSSP